MEGIDQHDAQHSELKMQTERSLALEMEQMYKKHTPYGSLIGSMVLEMGSKEYNWSFINPFALIYAACAINIGFKQMIIQNCCSCVASIALYADETRPGNQLSPHHGRKLYAIYWTFINLPKWVRSRENGWLTFGVLPYKKVLLLRHGLSTLMMRVLR
eukprot:3607600-Karenia_brevis.AAC.2